MGKNQIQFQKGLSLPQFFKRFGTEAQCHSALFRWRWPGGFIGPDCGHTGYSEIVGRGAPGKTPFVAAVRHAGLPVTDDLCVGVPAVDSFIVLKWMKSARIFGKDSVHITHK